jgi:Ribulose-phosphate 3 epimerase family
MAAIEPLQLAASILSADFCRLGEQVEEAMKAVIRLIHVDVMDSLENEYWKILEYFGRDYVEVKGRGIRDMLANAVNVGYESASDSTYW